MQSELNFSLAGLRIHVDGEVSVADDSLLRNFMTDGGPADVTIRVVPLTQPPAEDGVLLYSSVRYRVFETPTQLHFYTLAVNGIPRKEALCLVAEKGNASALRLYTQYPMPLQESPLLISILPERLLHLHNRTILHAAWVERDGKALLFSGDSGVGKSTQASLWERYRSSMTVNGDKTGLWLREDGVYASGVPFSGTSRIAINKTMPVRAVVMLAQGTENCLRRLPLQAAVRLLLAQMPVQNWDAQDVAMTLDYAVRLAQTVPIYSYCCTMDESAVHVLDERLGEEEVGST